MNVTTKKIVHLSEGDIQVACCEWLASQGYDKATPGQIKLEHSCNPEEDLPSEFSAQYECDTRTGIEKEDPNPGDRRYFVVCFHTERVPMYLSTRSKWTAHKSNAEIFDGEDDSPEWPPQPHGYYGPVEIKNDGFFSDNMEKQQEYATNRAHDPKKRKK